MFEYKNIKINYERIGDKKGDPIVLLHGWGQNIQMMKIIGEKYPKNDCLIIDFPGHGKSEEPKEIWTLDDFTNMVHELLKSLKINNPILIGHSFGGKIALIYASKYETKKLVLFGSPFKIKKNPKSLKVQILKSLKMIPGTKKIAEFAKKHIGSEDYKKASPVMRDILVRHVNTDITEEVKKITCPTIIIWGDHDEAVPIEDAYELSTYIKDSAVIKYEGCTHYAYLERLGQTISIIDSFIKWKGD